MEKITEISDSRLEIKVSDIINLCKKVRHINSYDLRKIDFLDDDGNKIEISEDDIWEWKFGGLNNTDFVTSGTLGEIISRKNKWNKI